MIYLCEREIGFDAAEIGFPSVMGCRAIVLVTGGGLFGYHLNGALNPGKQAAFVAFVNGHVQDSAMTSCTAATGRSSTTSSLRRAPNPTPATWTD